MASIPAELVEFLESGISQLVGSRDARLVPEVVRALGSRVEARGRELTMFLPVATSERTLANARENGRLAACFTAVDHRSYQVKGQFVAAGPAGDDDRRVIDRYRAALAHHFGIIGMPPRITYRLRHWPAYALRMRVETLFLQTPGPGAGVALVEAREGRRA